MARYGMVIDLSRCIACCSCMAACKAEHSWPPAFTGCRVLIKEFGSYPAVTRTVMPILCNHCKDAACVEVCPTGATSKRADGLVMVDSDKCMGCRYCMMACPYGSRSFLSTITSYFPGQGVTPQEAIGYQQLQTGVVIKCDFCQKKIDEGLKRGLKPGVAREATPSCVINCMGNARFFGDLDDPNSEVSQLIGARRGSQLHVEFGTDPSVYYLP